jgi:hypothetical protein
MKGKEGREGGKREASGDDGIWGNQVPAVGVTIWPQHEDMGGDTDMHGTGVLAKRYGEWSP